MLVTASACFSGGSMPRRTPPRRLPGCPSRCLRVGQELSGVPDAFHESNAIQTIVHERWSAIRKPISSWPVKTFISNNASYGTIRMHQEIAYKRRVHGTDLRKPDFAK